jgi:hypothetical protein
MEPSPPIQPPTPPSSEPVAPHPPPAIGEAERSDSHLPSELSTVSSASTASRGGGGGGRTSTSGRSLVSTGRRDGRGGRGESQLAANAAARGSHHHHNASSYGHHPAQRAVPVMIHSSSGVPFGHVPSYLPGSSSLVEALDRRVLLVLRDGKHLIGVRICVTLDRSHVKRLLRAGVFDSGQSHSEKTSCSTLKSFLYARAAYIHACCATYWMHDMCLLHSVTRADTGVVRSI